MDSKRLCSIGLATAILLSSIALGATAISAHERPTASNGVVDARPSASDRVIDAPNATSMIPSADTANATSATPPTDDVNTSSADTENATSATPAGYAPNHVDAAQAVAQHHREVVASTSVHTNLSYTATANGGASIRRVEAWTNYTRGAQRLSAQAVYAAAERYVENGVQYTNTSVSYNDAVRYNRTEGHLRVKKSTGRDVLSRFLPHLDLELQNSTTANGQRLFTYEAAGFDADSFSIYMREVAEVRSVDATLVVDEQGRIHEFVFELDSMGDDGNPLTVEVSLELDGFGETGVQRPSWVGEEFDPDQRVNGTLA